MADLDVPPAGIAAVAGQEGWDAVLATVADSVRGCIRRLDRADRQDLDAGRRSEAILAELREAAVADAAHRLVDARPDASVLTLWRGLAVLRPQPPGVDTGWTSPVDRSGPRWARVREDLVDAIDRIARQELAERFPPEGRRRCSRCCRGSRARPLVEVAAPRPGEQVEIYLRYLVNSRLQTPDQLAAERTVAGAEPRLIVKDN